MKPSEKAQRLIKAHEEFARAYYDECYVGGIEERVALESYIAKLERVAEAVRAEKDNPFKYNSDMTSLGIGMKFHAQVLEALAALDADETGGGK